MNKIHSFFLFGVLAGAASCSSGTPDDSESPGDGGTSGSGAAGSAGSMTANGGSNASGSGTGGSSVAGSNAAVGGSAGTRPVGSGGAAPGGSGGIPAAGTGNASGGGAGVPAAGSAGASPAGGSGGGASVACSMTVTQSLSEKIPTVAAVEWSADLPAIDSASIEYGLDTSYGMVAPVDLAEPNHRTLLLGMKTDKTYHFRVVANAGATQCASADQTVTTGFRPNEIAFPDITTPQPEKLYGGYVLSARWGNNNRGPAFILDADGELVWWYFVEDDVIRTRLSYDGKSIWIRNTGQTDGSGIVRRMSLDGLQEDRWELPHTTHDLAVMPDGRVGLIGHTSGCDEILIFDPETEMLQSIFNASEAHGKTSCHVNYLAYQAEDDSFTFSDYNDDSFTKISSDGTQIKWILNGQSSTFTGTSWSRQHAIHFITPEHVLVFNNGTGSAASNVFEFMLDLTSMSASVVKQYSDNLAVSNGGDVQRLENGNTMIAWSSKGVLQEVDSSWAVVQEFEWPAGNTISYIEKRKSLYGGPPPRIHPLGQEPALDQAP
ncbi:MAG TPA: aryl-sulfate sulfotransferase [Polyangiaceae bacterium]